MYPFFICTSHVISNTIITTCDPETGWTCIWTTQGGAYSRSVSPALLLVPSSACFSEVAPLVVQLLCRLSKDSFSTTSTLAGMSFIWKANYANKYTINFCSSTFFPLQRPFFRHLWCKMHQQPRSWYVNFTCQTEGMVRTSIAEQFPWWEKTIFMGRRKTWFTNSQTICYGIIQSLSALDQLLLYKVQLSFGKHRLPASMTKHRTEKGKEW